MSNNFDTQAELNRNKYKEQLSKEMVLFALYDIGIANIAYAAKLKGILSTYFRRYYMII